MPDNKESITLSQRTSFYWLHWLVVIFATVLFTFLLFYSSRIHDMPESGILARLG